jgi:quercetin dioxygenase-like cupin family protein
MSLPHAAPGDLIDVRPLGGALREAKTRAFFKADHFEVIRVVLLAGEKYTEHHAPGEITFQCLEGSVNFTALGKTRVLRTGYMLYLTSNERHAIEAIEDTCLLLTIQIVHEAM